MTRLPAVYRYIMQHALKGDEKIVKMIIYSKIGIDIYRKERSRVSL